jgi:hypothetical protein
MMMHVCGDKLARRDDGSARCMECGAEIPGLPDRLGMVLPSAGDGIVVGDPGPLELPWDADRLAVVEAQTRDLYGLLASAADKSDVLFGVLIARLDALEGGTTHGETEHAPGAGAGARAAAAGPAPGETAPVGEGVLAADTGQSADDAGVQRP